MENYGNITGYMTTTVVRIGDPSKTIICGAPERTIVVATEIGDAFSHLPSRFQGQAFYENITVGNQHRERE